MKRMIACLLALMMAGTFLGCAVQESTSGAGAPTPSDKTSASTGASASKEEGTSILDMPEDPIYRQPLLKVGNYEVTYGVYRHYYHLVAEMMAGEDGEYFTKNPEKIAELQEETLKQCRITGAYFNLAEKAGIKLPSEKEVNEAFEKFVKEYEGMFPLYYGMTMAEYMEKNAMTPSSYKVFYVIDTYISPSIYKYVSDEKNGMIDLSNEALEKAMEDWRCVKHILVGYNDNLSSEAALKLAQELVERLKAGEDMDELMKQYSNDYQKEGKNVYTFTYDQMVKPFEDMSFSMEEGAISDPVKSEFGYHVIKRLPIDKEAFRENEFLSVAVNTGFEKYAYELPVNQLSSVSDLKHEDLMK